MKTGRAIILIDGSNFYHKLKDLGLHTLDFDYSAFIQLLVGKREIVGSTYFVFAHINGALPDIYTIKNTLV